MNGLMPLKEILEREFPKEQIKQKKSKSGKSLSYIQAWNVIDRLNEAFGYKWNWEIVSHEVRDRQIICIGRLTVKIDGETIIKEAFGSKEIETLKADKNIAVNELGDDLKAACSDALKKAASLFGIGLHLYRGTLPAQTQPQNRQPKNVIDVSKYYDYAKTLNNKKYAMAE